MDKDGGAVIQQEVAATESPQHADARHAAGTCRHHVDIAVTDVHRTGVVGTQLTQGFVYRVGGGFLAYAFPLTYRHVYQRSEEVAA